MARSGNFEKKIAGGSYGGYYVGVDWSIKSQSTSGTGSSVITASTYVRSTGNGYNISSSAQKTISITVNGEKRTTTNTIGIGVNSKKVLMTQTFTVAHNSDGRKNCAFRGAFVVGFTLAGTSLGTVEVTGSADLDAINLNSAPVLTGSASLNVSGTIPENTGNITISWPAASDANLSGYRVYRYVNGSHDGSWWPGNVRSMTDNIGGLAQGARVYYTVWAYDALEWFSGSISTPTITKNTLTGATFKGHSNDIAATTTSFKLQLNAASNTNGNGSFKYYYYSDDVTVYHSPDDSSLERTINIWRDTAGGSEPAKPYIKLSDLINKYKGQSYNGRLHVGVRTTNAYGSQKWSGGSIGVDLRSNPTAATPTISTNSSYSTAYRRAATGKSYFIPDGNNKIRIDWSGGKDTIGQPLTYDVQYKIGSGGFVSGGSNISGTARDIVLPVQSSSQSLTIRLVTKTAYGNTASKDSGSQTLHFYNAPKINIKSINRAATSATAVINIVFSSSLGATLTAQYEWDNDVRNLVGNTSDQTINVTGLNENMNYAIPTYVKDNLYTTSNQVTTINIPTQRPVMSIRENGVGIGMAPNGNADLMVGGSIETKEINIKGYQQLNTEGSHVNKWLKLATLTVTTRYGDSGFTSTLSGTGSGGDTATNAKIIARLKQQNEMGQAPSCSLQISEAVITSASRFKMVIRTNTTSATVAEVWFQPGSGYESCWHRPENRYGTVQFHENQPFQTSLPSGTVINAADKTPLMPSDLTSGNGNLYGKVMRIGTDGVVEAGKYLDFHDGDNGQDYSARMVCYGDKLEVSGQFQANSLINMAGKGHLANIAGSWLQGATNASLLTHKLSQGSYHPLICQTTFSNHKVSMGGIDNKFGFFLYDKDRTANGVDREFVFNLNDKTFFTSCEATFGRRAHFHEWIYTKNGLYFPDHDGGWFMSDSTWLRSYGGKSIYAAGGEIRTDGTCRGRYFRGPDNTNVDVTGHGSGQVYTKGGNCTGAAYIGKQEWGEITIYPSGDNIGNLGTNDRTWNTLKSTNKSLSASLSEEKSHNISPYTDTEYLYETYRNMNLYMMNNSSTHYEEEIEGVNGRFKIKKLEKPKIVKSQEIKLVCNASELPMIIAPKNKENDDGNQAVELGAMTTGLVGAFSHACKIIETQEQKINELEDKLNRLEEIVNGFIG